MAVNQTVGQRAEIGLVGLAVMGENLALNIAGKGFRIAVYNRTVEKVDAFHRRAGALAERIVPCRSTREFAASLERPRRVILLVKAGPPVDAMISELKSVLEPGDILVDSGNSHFRDTERRAGELSAAGLRFVGMGISGGEEGALHGPSLMPGGEREAFQALEPILTRVAAQVDDGPCTTYLGPGGSGHFVKMVHNGIEYADMQLIGETYDLLSNALGLGAGELADLFAEWNRGELRSYLIEITADIFRKIDPDTREASGGPGPRPRRAEGHREVDFAERPGPRHRHSEHHRRGGGAGAVCAEGGACRGRGTLSRPRQAPEGPREAVIAQVRAALYAAKVSAYAQGMALLAAASREHRYGLDLREIARIWKGGCIIRAALLDRIRAAYARNGNLPSLLVDPRIPPRGRRARRGSTGRRFPGGAPRRARPGAVGLARLLRYLPTRETARQPAPGPARLLRSPHLREDRPPRHVPLELEGVGPAADPRGRTYPGAQGCRAGFRSAAPVAEEIGNCP
jgi:6-phosphogluconate dehydrogenase